MKYSYSVLTPSSRPRQVELNTSPAAVMSNFAADMQTLATSADHSMRLDSDFNSEYSPSLPPSPSALSFDSTATDRMTPSSPATSTQSSDEVMDQADKDGVLPPLTFSALIVQANEAESGVVALENPFTEQAFGDAWALLQSTLSDAQKSDLLKEWIATFEVSNETRNEYLVAAMRDENLAKMVVDKYAEQIEIARLRTAKDNADLNAYGARVKAALADLPNTTEAGVLLSGTLAHLIDLYAYVVPKNSEYKKRSAALTGLIAVGEGVLASPEAAKREAMRRGLVGKKLGLAFVKLVRECGWFEEKKKNLGYMKRTGKAGKMKAILGQWPDVRLASGGLVELD